MRRAFKGGAAAVAAVVALAAVTAAGPATATPADSPTTSSSATGQGLSQTNLPVLVDAAADLTANPSRNNESWYVIAHANAGGHRYGFLAHYMTVGDATTGVSISKVSITDETTGWYTKSEVVLPPRSGLSQAPGVDVHTQNITWTGDVNQMTLQAKVPEGQIDVTLRPRGPVLYNMGTGYFPMFADPKYPNYEYALPTMDTSGTLTLNGRTEKLDGDSWLDHQWGPLPDLTKGQAGWTWMGLGLSDGTRMSVWKTTNTTTNTWATVLAPDGTQTVAAATITPDSSDTWTSPESHRTYPTRWTLTIPGLHTTLKVTAAADNQELLLPGPGLEASSTVNGTYDGRHATGFSYVEDTTALK